MDRIVTNINVLSVQSNFHLLHGVWPHAFCLVIALNVIGLLMSPSERHGQELLAVNQQLVRWVILNIVDWLLANFRNWWLAVVPSIKMWLLFDWNVPELFYLLWKKWRTKIWIKFLYFRVFEQKKGKFTLAYRAESD